MILNTQHHEYHHSYTSGKGDGEYCLFGSVTVTADSESTKHWDPGIQDPEEGFRK